MVQDEGAPDDGLRQRDRQAREALCKKSFFRPEPCKSGEEFVRRLHRIGLDDRKDDGGESGEWSFRGQNDVEKVLRPSAWRPENEWRGDTDEWANSINKEIGEYRSHPIFERDEWQIDEFDPHRAARILGQTRMEIEMVRRFWSAANRLAIDLPTSVPPPKLNQLLPSTRRTIGLWDEESIRFERNPTFALAQHHGVPTRLLDFTSNPLIAAYFAAKKCPTASSRTLGVFALRSLHHQGLLSFSKFDDVLRCKNHFLHAQSGHFVTLKNAHSFYIQQGYWPSLEDLLVTHVDSSKMLGGDVIIYLFELPASESTSVLRELARHGITQMTVEPTLHHVGEGVRAKRSEVQYGSRELPSLRS